MPTPDETKILRIIDAEGGESTVRKIARKMGLDSSYARVILQSMGRNDLIDLFGTGKVRIAIKGWLALGKQPQQGKGLQRYLEDRAKWKTF
ncbi:MAG: hypothetical protein COT45_02145 [bacterium (Candidatus Stahlbacteria) CG08_land_8_20_14_0_20_40_26]|nr:MAG: hypothetical protein COT45_02145 [bacterium (Candidatus Stahlbacteria) CG08_land_8_20_14_0_20_40_26]